MNLNLNFGKDKEGKDIFIDLQKENLHTTFMTGTTGSGKSILYFWLCKQLMELNTPNELRFVFMDMTRVDFVPWKTPFLFMPTIVNPDLALDELEKLSVMNFTNQALVICIEECDMAAYNPVRFENAWGNLHKNNSNVYAFFSTSRPSSRDVFTPVVQNNTAMRIVFNLSTTIDSMTVLGKSMAESFRERGEKVISYKDQEILSGPFSEDTVKELNVFGKAMSG